MNIKLKSLEGMAEEEQKLFKKVGEEYVYEVPDVDGLKKKVDELLNEKKTAAQKAKEAEEAAEAARLEAAKKAGDITALESSWQKKLDDAIKSATEKNGSLEKMIYDLSVGSEAAKLASSLAISGSADVLIPHIKNRLTVDMSTGSPVVKVLDLSGKPSALNIDDLGKEISGNKAFAPLIAATHGSGAGYKGGSGGAGDKTISRADFEKLPPLKRSETIKSGVEITD